MGVDDATTQGAGEGPVERAPNRGLAFAAALFEEWERAGLAHVCVCPGSRSAPLALAAAGSGLRRWTHLDERSAAFFALGLAKATRTPVAILCTSGSAALNFAPAVVEAHYARVPLLVLTADRPPELREWGAGQAIDQHGLFGSHVRWFAEVATPSARPERLRYARALASRAIEECRGAAPGPVHLNLPFRDPLDPRPVADDVAADLHARDPHAARGREGRPYLSVRSGSCTPTAHEVEDFCARASRAERGVIVVGPLDAAPEAAASIDALARRLGWPLIADATSPLRALPAPVSAPTAHRIVAGHALLSNADFAAAHAPDFVLRFGAMPTSKAFAQWLDRHASEEVVAVDPDALWHDPNHRVSERHRAEPGVWCDAVIEGLARDPASALPPSAWLRAFEGAEAAAQRAIHAALAEDDTLLEARAVRELADTLPSDATLYVSNSMPVRDVDAFWPARAGGPRVLCNRGVNGIDGLVSSALGAAAAEHGPVVLLTGDLAFLYDVSGLLSAQRFGLPLVTVVLDNDGGGIFSMLPIAENTAPETFREHFRTPHGHDLARLAEGAGVNATRVESWQHFRSAMKEALHASTPQVIVVKTDPDASREQRRRVAVRLAEALAGSAQEREA